MPKFLVKVARLVALEYTIEAVDEADAKARYRENGEEVVNKIEKQVAFKVEEI